jgi:hypothetical protein
VQRNAFKKLKELARREKREEKRRRLAERREKAKETRERLPTDDDLRESL